MSLIRGGSLRIDIGPRDIIPVEQISYRNTNINYTKFSELNYTKSDPLTAVEIKASIYTNVDQLLKEFPFQRVRFSKYCRGFNYLFN